MKISKSLISIVLSIALGVGLIIFVFLKYPFKDVISTFKNVTPLLVISYLSVSLIIMCVFALRWRILLNAQGYKGIPFFHLLSYRTVDYGVSYLTPTAKIAGEPVRAALLTRNGISFKDGLTTVTIDKTIELSFTVILFVIGCFLLILTNALSFGVAVFLVILSAFLIFLNWTFYYRIWQGKPIFISLFRFIHLDKVKFLARYQNTIIEFEKPIIHFYNEKKKAYFAALGLTIFAFMLSMIEYHLLLTMVGVHPTLKDTFMVFSVVGMAFLMPVPMGLGSLEAMQAWLFSALGLGSAAGVGLAMITRSRDLLWVLAAVFLALYFGSLKRVFTEAFNSSYNNPIVKMTVFRGGQPSLLNIRLHKKKDQEYLSITSLLKKQELMNRLKNQKKEQHHHYSLNKPLFGKK